MVHSIAAHHVSMMHDSVIANMDATSLRAVLRGMLSTSAGNTSLFVRLAIKQLTAVDIRLLTPPMLSRHARCLFAIGLVDDAINLLAVHVVPNLDSLSIEDQLKLDHDIVQAVQSAKETGNTDLSSIDLLLGALDSAKSRTSDKFSLQRGLIALESLRRSDSSFHLSSSSNTEIPSSGLPTVQLGSVECPRLFLGLWQLSSPNWGTASEHDIADALIEHATSGFTAFDMADHYGDAEVLFGKFRRTLVSPRRVIVATKWCVFKSAEATRESVHAAVAERIRRLQGSVDILQFHWQDYGDESYIDILRHLVDIKDNGEGIRAIGLCNFDTKHLTAVCEALPPGSIVSNQVQFSLIDTRPLHEMCAACVKYGVKLLTYGTLCGGLLTHRYMDSQPPNPYNSDFTPSLRKYLDMVYMWGNWDEFQTLLKTLNTVGQRHGVTVANVATRWVLEQEAVGAVIIGARLGVSSNINDNLSVFDWTLSQEDKTEILTVLGGRTSAQLVKLIGDCGGEYR